MTNTFWDMTFIDIFTPVGDITVRIPMWTVILHTTEVTNLIDADLTFTTIVRTQNTLVHVVTPRVLIEILVGLIIIC